MPETSTYAKAISTYNAKLKITPPSSAGGTATTYDIKDFPDMMGEPNMLETTTMSDDQQTYVAGIKQISSMSFTMNYKKDVFTALKTSEMTAGYEYELSFSDGTKLTWTGMHSVSIAGKSVDEVIEFKLNVAPSTTITVA